MDVSALTIQMLKRRIEYFDQSILQDISKCYYKMMKGFKRKHLKFGLSGVISKWNFLRTTQKRLPLMSVKLKVIPTPQLLRHQISGWSIDSTFIFSQWREFYIRFSVQNLKDSGVYCVGEILKVKYYPWR